jgi:hypothetical protein
MKKMLVLGCIALLVGNLRAEGVFCINQRNCPRGRLCIAGSGDWQGACILINAITPGFRSIQPGDVYIKRDGTREELTAERIIEIQQRATQEPDAVDF